MRKFDTIKHFAIQNRKKETEAGKILYRAVRQLGKELGFKKNVRREYLIYPYIADVFIGRYGIVLEADGKYHNNRLGYDNRRDNFLEDLGLVVLRFENSMILNRLPEVLKFIANVVKQRKNYWSSAKYKLNNLVNSPFGKTEKGQQLIRKFKSRERCNN